MLLIIYGSCNNNYSNNNNKSSNKSPNRSRKIKQHDTPVPPICLFSTRKAYRGDEREAAAASQGIPEVKYAVHP